MGSHFQHNQTVSADPYPDFEVIHDGIMHSAGMTPVRCVCGAELVEAGARYHAEHCQILHMRRVVWRKNNRKPKSERK